MQTIEITGTTGMGPYDIYLCDTTLSYCYLVTGSTNIPPSYTFELTPLFAGSSAVIVKIVDTSSGCEDFNIYTCFTPTPSPTPPPTPTPTPTSNCRCIQAVNSTSGNGSFVYTDCFGSSTTIIVPANSTVYYCGSNPTSASIVTVTLSGECISYSCV